MSVEQIEQWRIYQLRLPASLLTPSFSVSAAILEKHFREIIHGIYFLLPYLSMTLSIKYQHTVVINLTQQPWIP